MAERLCIIIPCHNESACILNVLKDLRTFQPDARFVVVNDCSTDDTARLVAEDGSAVLLNLPVNLGVGAAVQTGFLYALENGFDCAVKFDGDGQHSAQTIDSLLEPLRNGEADLVIGSRFLTHDGFQSTVLRRMGISFFRLLCRLLTKRTITDNTSGFRAYNHEALAFASVHYPSFDYPEPEEVVLMGRNGFRLKEVPIVMHERKGGRSSLSSPVNSIYYMLKVSLAMVFAAIRPRFKGRAGK
jgi:glycosyltransferase involved in cell wall biosynthesis